MKKLLVLLILLAMAGGGGYAYWQRTPRAVTAFRTAEITRGDLMIAISATGTVEPIEVVDVGAQVAGKIEAFGEDPAGTGKPIDYGTMVEKDTVLARIDDAMYQAEVEQVAAQVEQAKANVLRTEADLQQSQARLRQAEQNWTRAKELGPSKALAATDYDSYEAAYEIGKAVVAVSEATVTQARKSVVQAEASLKRAQTSLSYCTIRSPVKGVIIDRRVNIGQTVVASLNAPSLFLIAKDLTKMQVWAAVNEADIGSIKAGQPVSFTVDAFPGQEFRGEVGKIRLNASMTQNVVTYTVEINTDNSDGKLLPYLTANVRFHIAERRDVLMVPNGALRWRPSEEQVAPELREASGEQGERNPSSGPDSRPALDEPHPDAGTIWLLQGSFVRPLQVIVGPSDGNMTEISGDDLQEGTRIVIGEIEQKPGETNTSPFTPKLFGGKRGFSGGGGR